MISDKACDYSLNSLFILNRTRRSQNTFLFVTMYTMELMCTTIILFGQQWPHVFTLKLFSEFVVEIIELFRT